MFAISKAADINKESTVLSLPPTEENKYCSEADIATIS
jgi:hypothetical protein